MAEIFVSYKREDEARAKRIVEALRAEGFDVWWDQGIGSGASWRNEIRARIEVARVICVLWSKSSVNSDWVLEEAEFGKEKGNLCPALIDDVKPAIGFGQIQASNLVGWRGDVRDPAWKHYASCVRARLRGVSPPERRPPRPRVSLYRVAAVAFGALVAVVSLFAAAEQFGVIDVAPNLVAANGTRAATPRERETWTRVRDSGDCSAIRAYLNANPSGAFATEAQALLTARSEVTEASWRPFEQTAPVTGSSPMEARASREVACAAAQARAQTGAEQVCASYGGAYHRNMEATLENAACDCRDNSIQNAGAPSPPLWTCSVRTTATCRGEAREDVSVESCGAA